MFFKEERFDIELYDKAVSLPQCESVNCPTAEDKVGDYQYGIFNGKQTFTTDGKIDKKDLKAQSGWITLNGRIRQINSHIIFLAYFFYSKRAI